MYALFNSPQSATLTLFIKLKYTFYCGYTKVVHYSFNKIFNN